MTKDTLANIVKAVPMTGTLKFWHNAKGFGIVTTAAGDVLVHVTKAGDWLEPMKADGAKIDILVTTKYEDGGYKRSATAVTNVTLPEVRTVWASVKTFNAERCSATVFLGELDLLGQTAFIPKSVIQGSAIVPGVGMPMRATIVRTTPGWDVRSYESNEKVAADYDVYMANMRARVEAEQSAVIVAPAVEKVAQKKRVRQSQLPKDGDALKQILAHAASQHVGNPLADAFAAATIH
jgi:cold shock CspA family protein